MNETRNKAISRRLRQWLSLDPAKESLARQMFYLRDLPLGKRIKGRLVSGSKLLSRLGGWRTIFTQPNSNQDLDREFESVLARVANAEDVSVRDLLPYLCAESTKQRAYANMRLAEAYLRIDKSERLSQARVFAERAWLLSRFSNETFLLYERILLATADAGALREAYKRMGVAAARQGALLTAIQYFDHWQYAYHKVERVDRYGYDWDVLRAVEEMAAPYRFRSPVSSPKRGERIRVAHLLRGIVEHNSNLVRISQQFARHHDRSRFDVLFFAPETDLAIDSSPQGRDFIRTFEQLGYKVVTASEARSQEEALLRVASKIYRAKPHVLLTSAALADFSQAFLTALHPAPLAVGLVQGPPQQFAPPWLDWSIAWSKHPLMDTPVDCSHVDFKLDWVPSDPIVPYKPSDLGLPANAFVIMSAGRPPKFQDPQFWRMIDNLVGRHSHAHFIAVGPTDDKVPLLYSMLSAETRNSVKCFGWREDVLPLLASAHVVLDTYPNGGGLVLVEAMTLGVPIVAHRNNYLTPFDQNAWSPVEDFIDDPELVVARGDFIEFERVVEQMIVDEEFRRQAAARCQAAVQARGGADAVRNCEDVIAKLVTARGRPPNAKAARV